MVLVWIKLSGPPRFMHKRRILETVGGKYGHLKELCPSPVSDKVNETGKISGNLELPKSTTEGEGPAFRPWMVVERKSRQRLKDLRNQKEGDTENEFLGSRFAALKGLENLELRKDERDERISVG
ncbi:hypothetical protein Golax_016635, partial [Gossypium laxum]|nr:hypothetical protein [Gossypium laxum]